MPEPPAGTVDPDVVKELEKLLNKAKTGDMTGIAYASLHPGGFTTYNRAGRMTRGVIGALTLMQWDMCKTDIEAD